MYSGSQLAFTFCGINSSESRNRSPTSGICRMMVSGISTMSVLSLSPMLSFPESLMLDSKAPSASSIWMNACCPYSEQSLPPSALMPRIPPASSVRSVLRTMALSNLRSPPITIVRSEPYALISCTSPSSPAVMVTSEPTSAMSGAVNPPSRDVISANAFVYVSFAVMTSPSASINSLLTVPSAAPVTVISSITTLPSLAAESLSM